MYAWNTPKRNTKHITSNRSKRLESISDNLKARNLYFQTIIPNVWTDCPTQSETKINKSTLVNDYVITTAVIKGCFLFIINPQKMGDMK